jgi:hypothetical protein
MIGCETYAEYIARITGTLSSAWGASHSSPSLSKAHVENDLDGWA